MKDQFSCWFCFVFVSVSLINYEELLSNIYWTIFTPQMWIVQSFVLIYNYVFKYEQCILLPINIELFLLINNKYE